MKTLLAMALGTVPLLATGTALAQNGHMMNGGGWGGGWMGGYGGMGGGYGGILVPVLLVIAAVGLVVWVVRQKRK